MRRRWTAWVAMLTLACGGPPAEPEDGGAPRAGDAAASADGSRPRHDGAPPAIDGAPPDASSGPPPVVFEDVTREAGLAFVHRKPDACLFDPDGTCQIDHMTGGAAVGDVDGDGWPDLYVTNLEGPDRLHRNRGDGTFEEITEAAGLGGFAAHSNGAAFVDIDEDGDLDLYVTVLGGPIEGHDDRFFLFVNDGAGRFTEEALARGAAVDDSGGLRGGASVATGDYDRDGYADLHVNEWVPIPATRPHTRLLHNRGAEAPGHFEDATLAARATTFSQECWLRTTRCTQYAFASGFADLDGDGWQDLVVAMDFGLSRTFLNRGDGTFALGQRTSSLRGDENGMGSTLGDVDNDGDLDWLVTSIFDPEHTCATEPCTWGASGNRLYENGGDGRFADATDGAGVRDGGWGWGAAFLDYDNDGDLDVVQANGVDYPVGRFDDDFNDDATRLWENDGHGGMRERARALGIASRATGKGLLVFDYDRDGDQDVFVVNDGATPALYRNDGGSARPWLRVRCRGAAAGGSTSEGLGARVEVTVDGVTQVREIGSVTHFLGQSERVAHVGLGAGHETVDVLAIRWPSGRVTRMTDVPARQELLVDEPPE
ncbi:MAG TPA: CRTAC1 family protein [Sandaracinaceae bacterium LLY-WYZ-13_1]|nr:CRTAC1 family protein [Sandaracinaceae bacterium LLY-WYZ-13_1]